MNESSYGRVIMKCQHYGCNRTLVVDCIKAELIECGSEYDYLDESTRKKMISDSLEYFCPEHCEDHGYCWNCGAPIEASGRYYHRGELLCRSCHEEL